MWQDNLAQSKANTDLRLVAEQILGQPARRSSRYVQYHAPSRRDTSPSLTIWADGYKDFGGDDSGDLFHFLATYANFTFPEALQFLEGHTTFAAESRRPDHSRANHQPSAAWQSAVSDFLAHAQHTLWHTRAGDHARAYLESQGYRPSTIESRGLGLNLRWHRLEISGESEPFWVAPGILYPWRQSDTLYGVKIRLPYHDDLARRLNLAPGPMKYMQIRGSQLTWYGEITDATLPLILVEGEKDRDNLAQIAQADQFNIITLGSATGRIPDSLWPHLRQAAWIAIVLDNDAAGQSNATRLADHLNSRLLADPAFTVSLPTTAKDLTEWLLSGGDLAAWLTSLTNPRPHPVTPPPSLLPLPDSDKGSEVDSSPSSLPLAKWRGGRGGEVNSSPSLLPLPDSDKGSEVDSSPSSLPLAKWRGGRGGEVNSSPSPHTNSPTYLEDAILPTPLSTQWGGVGGGDASYFPNGLPDALREILLGLHQLTPQGRAYIADHSAAALVLELITDAYRHHHLTEPDFTIQHLAEIAATLNRQTSAKTIRRGLDQLAALNLVELIPFSTPLKPSSNFPTIQGCENGNNPCAVSPLPMFGEGLGSTCHQSPSCLPHADSLPTPLSTRWGGDVSFPLADSERGLGGEVLPTPLSTQWGGVGGGDSLPFSTITDNDKLPAITTTRGRPAQKYRPLDFRYALPKFLEILGNRLRESLYAATIPAAVDPAWFESIPADDTTRAAWADTISDASAELDQTYADRRAKIEEDIDLRLYAWSLRLNWLSLRSAASTAIPADLPFASGRAYRDAYYQARVAAAGMEGRQISRAKAAAEIGVNSRTLSRVRERVGIVTEEQYKEFDLCRAENILDQADLLAPWAAQRPFGRYLKSSTGARIALNSHADQWVATQLAAGHAVVLQIQVASREHLTTPEDARQQRQHRLEQYRARCAKPVSQPDSRPADRHFRTSLRNIQSSFDHIPAHRDSPNFASNFPAPLSTQWGGVGGGDIFCPLADSVSEDFATPLSLQWGGSGDFTFSLAFVRDQLALRLPYLDTVLQSDPTLRAAIAQIMYRAEVNMVFHCVE